jgi:hypothetical protein
VKSRCCRSQQVIKKSKIRQVDYYGGVNNNVWTGGTASAADIGEQRGEKAMFPQGRQVW